MRMKVSNYISEMLVKAGIHQAFMVTGGGAMHLDDALGHQEGLHCIYDHHEQACAIAAEAYARIHNKIGALCVTTGPGGTNAITGVVGGWPCGGGRELWKMERCRESNGGLVMILLS